MFFFIIRLTVKYNSHKEFKEKWDDIKSCRHGNESMMYPNQVTAATYVTMSKKKLRLVTGIITGHCHLNKQLFNMKLSDTPHCRGCQQDYERAEHILADCI